MSPYWRVRYGYGDWEELNLRELEKSRGEKINVREEGETKASWLVNTTRKG